MTKSAKEAQTSATDLLEDLKTKLTPVEVADVLGAEVAGPVLDADEIEAFRAWKIKEAEEKEKAERAAKAKAEAEKIPEGPVLMKMYDIVADAITGSSANAAEQNLSILKGRVTSADLEQAEVDIEFLLKIGAIEEAGFAYV